MTKIPGIIFIAVGGLISFVSNYLNNLKDNNSLTLFVYVGYGFIAYGVAKVIINFILRKGKDESNHREELPEPDASADEMHKRNMMRNHHKQVQQNSQNQQRNDMYGYIGYCNRCNTPMRKINIYCHRCGVKQ